MTKLILTTALVFSLALANTYILISVLSRKEKFKRLRKKKILYSIIGAGCVTILFVVAPPIGSNNTATIESEKGQFLVTLSARRTGLENNPLSTTIKKPYHENLELAVPKDNGIIDAEEFIVDDPDDSTNLTGKLIVGPWKITADLYYQGRPTRWNASYRIVKKKFSLE